MQAGMTWLGPLLGIALGPFAFRICVDALDGILGHKGWHFSEMWKGKTKARKQSLLCSAAETGAMAILNICVLPLIADVFRHWSQSSQRLWLDTETLNYYRSFVWISGAYYVFELVWKKQRHVDIWCHHIMTVFLVCFSYSGESSFTSEKDMPLVLCWIFMYGWGQSFAWLVYGCMIAYHLAPTEAHHRKTQIMTAAFVFVTLKDIAMNTFGYSFLVAHWSLLDGSGQRFLALAPAALIPAQIHGILTFYQIMMMCRRRELHAYIEDHSLEQMDEVKELYRQASQGAPVKEMEQKKTKMRSMRKYLASRIEGTLGLVGHGLSKADAQAIFHNGFLVSAILDTHNVKKPVLGLAQSDNEMPAETGKQSAIGRQAEAHPDSSI